MRDDEKDKMFKLLQKSIIKTKEQQDEGLEYMKNFLSSRRVIDYEFGLLFFNPDESDEFSKKFRSEWE